jgi:hypothetical protein
MTKKLTLILLHLTLAWLSYDVSALLWNAVETQVHGWYLTQCRLGRKCGGGAVALNMKKAGILKSNTAFVGGRYEGIGRENEDRRMGWFQDSKSLDNCQSKSQINDAHQT